MLPVLWRNKAFCILETLIYRLLWRKREGEHTACLGAQGWLGGGRVPKPDIDVVCATVDYVLLL